MLDPAAVSSGGAACYRSAPTPVCGAGQLGSAARSALTRLERAGLSATSLVLHANPSPPSSSSCALQFPPDAPAAVAGHPDSPGALVRVHGVPGCWRRAAAALDGRSPLSGTCWKRHSSKASRDRACAQRRATAGHSAEERTNRVTAAHVALTAQTGGAPRGFSLWCCSGETDATCTDEGRRPPFAGERPLGCARALSCARSLSNSRASAAAAWEHARPSWRRAARRAPAGPSAGAAQ